MRNNFSYDKEAHISEVISFLRFPLVVLVVMIHCHFGSVSITGDTIVIDANNFPMYSNVSFFVSDLLARVAVPILFIFSGILFFKDAYESFSIGLYINKLQKRLKTLLIPYLFWNVVVITVLLLAEYVAPQLFSGSNRLISSYDIYDWVCAFVGNIDGDVNPPVSYQFWYIRDLLFCVLVSPLIYYTVKFLKRYLIISLSIIWLIGLDANIIVVGTTSLFFFSLGAYLTIEDFDIHSFLRKAFPYATFISICTAVTKMLVFNGCFALPSLWDMLMLRLYILSTIICVISLVSYGLEQKKIKRMPFFEKANFFVYAYHILPLSFFIKVLMFYIRPSNDFGVLFIYFISSMLTISVGLLAYYIIKKVMPSFTALITGSRC